MKNSKQFFLILLCSVGLSASAQDNLVGENYGFEDGTTTGWYFGGGDFASMEADANGILCEDYSVKFEITAAPTNVWDIQFAKGGNPVVQDEVYYFSFMAYVEEELTVNIDLELGADPYTRYWDEVFTLTPDTVHYKRMVVPNASDENATLKFFLGYADNVDKVLYIDSLVLSTEEFLYGEPVEPVSIEKINQLSNISVYPNPTNSKFTIELNALSEITMDLEVYDICGQKVRTLLKDYTFTDGFNQQFNAKDLKPGIYFIRGTGEGMELNRKLIVK